jgi:hypothetical protein
VFWRRKKTVGKFKNEINATWTSRFGPVVVFLPSWPPLMQQIYHALLAIARADGDGHTNSPRKRNNYGVSGGSVV